MQYRSKTVIDIFGFGNISHYVDDFSSYLGGDLSVANRRSLCHSGGEVFVEELKLMTRIMNAVATLVKLIPLSST